MNEQEKINLALEIGEYWSCNCTDDDFYDNCIENIIQELKEDAIDIDGNVINDEVYEIWNIIEQNYA